MESDMKSKRKFKVGQRVLLKSFNNGDEIVGEETAEILEVTVKPSGEVILGVEVDTQYLQSEEDDGTREVSASQVKKFLKRGT